MYCYQNGIGDYLNHSGGESDEAVEEMEVQTERRYRHSDKYKTRHLDRYIDRQRDRNSHRLADEDHKETERRSPESPSRLSRKSTNLSNDHERPSQLELRDSPTREPEVACNGESKLASIPEDLTTKSPRTSPNLLSDQGHEKDACDQSTDDDEKLQVDQEGNDDEERKSEWSFEEQFKQVL